MKGLQKPIELSSMIHNGLKAHIYLCYPIEDYVNQSLQQIGPNSQDILKEYWPYT